MSDFYHYLHFVFIGFIALFPVVNPLGSAFIVSPYFSGLSNKERVNAVKRIAFYVFFMSLIVLLSGRWILDLFGISVPIVQVAGGILICKIGWDFLSPAKTNVAVNPSDEKKDLNPGTTIENKLFYPITFPITAGGGTISVLLTLSAHDSNKNISEYLIYNSAILLAVIGICLLVFICYVNANKLINYLGSHREKIVNNIMAFLIFCVGLQIAVEGITKLIK
jgi:multiple antibiotic resistance protein